MVAVFAVFGTLSMTTFKQLGVGLAVAILLDATVVRAVLLPSVLTLLGDRTWWLPRLAVVPAHNCHDATGRSSGATTGARAGPCRTLDEIIGGLVMQRWEYVIADVTKLEAALPELNRLGEQGWEGVGLVSTWGASGWRFVHPVVLLKRPLPDSAQ